MKISQRTGRLQRPAGAEEQRGASSQRTWGRWDSPLPGTRSPQLHFPLHRHRQAQEGP